MAGRPPTTVDEWTTTRIIHPNEDEWTTTRVVPADAPGTVSAAPPKAPGFLDNLGASNAAYWKSLGEAFSHPVKAIEGLGTLALGAAAKASRIGSIEPEGAPSLAPAVATFDNYMDLMKSRYGGWENLKHTAYTDPVGFAADFATVFGGAAGLAKLGGFGRIAAAAATGAKFADPMQLGLTTATGIGRLTKSPVAKILGLTTGEGGRAISQAIGNRTEPVLAGLRGNVAWPEVREDLLDTLEKAQAERKATYEAGKAALPRPPVIDPTPIAQTLQDSLDRFGVQTRFTKRGRVVLDFHGPTSVVPEAEHVQFQQAFDRTFVTVKDPTRFNFDSLDALRQYLRNVGGVYKKSGATRAQAFVESLRDSIKDLLAKKVPGYENVLANYQDLSDLITQARQEFSVGGQTSVGTGIRKLQGTLFDPTEYRSDLLQALDKYGSEKLRNRIAGLTLSQWEPKGLMRTLAAGDIIWNVFKTFHPSSILPLIATSPRIVGETVSVVPRAAKGVRTTAALGQPAIRTAQLLQAPNVDIIRGSSNIPLSPEGRQQALDLGKQFAAAGGLNQVYYGTLDRSRDSANTIATASGLEARSLGEGLNPWNLGQFEGRPTKIVLPQISRYMTQQPDAAIPGKGSHSTQQGESFNSFKTRALTQIQQLMQQYQQDPTQKLGVVTHYRNIRLLDAWLKRGTPPNFDIDTKELLHDGTLPGSVHRLYPTDKGWRLEEVKPQDSLPGGIYMIRHGKTAWNGQPEGN